MFHRWYTSSMTAPEAGDRATITVRPKSHADKARVVTAARKAKLTVNAYVLKKLGLPYTNPKQTKKG